MFRIDPAKCFFISDTHFGSEELLKYEKRPFETVDKMDALMKGRIHSALKEEDHIFFLGDVSHHNLGWTESFIKSIKGTKHLVIGNHDLEHKYTEAGYRTIGYHYIYHFPVCINEFFWLSHEPMYLNEHMPYVNIHGHIHGNIMQSKLSPNRYVNVSVEHTDYGPISLETIMKEKLMMATKKEVRKYKIRFKSDGHETVIEGDGFIQALLRSGLIPVGEMFRFLDQSPADALLLPNWDKLSYWEELP